MSLPKRIGVLISGRGSNMATLARAFGPDNPQAQVVTVLADNAAAQGLTLARDLGVPHVHACEYGQYASKALFEQALIDHLQQQNIDLVCLAGYMRLLSRDFCAQFAGKMLNIHPSLLPLYKGLDTHQRALAAGDTRAGCTVHYVTPQLDSGDIVAQASVPIVAGDTEATLAQRVLRMEHVLYPQAVRAALVNIA